jgi:cell division protein FtsZ
VIDPDMADDLKVTVVATGLGSEAVRAAPLQVVDSAPKQVDPAEAPVRRRAVTEERPASAEAAVETGLAAAVGQEDYFDIPAFLRRQAD